MANKYDYFVSFLKNRIIRGEKQVDISKNTGLSTAWINKIFKDKAKSCPFKTQKIIAEYFQITYDQMLIEGQRLYDAEFPEDHPLEEEDKSGIVDLLKQAISAVREKEKLLEIAEDKANELEKLREKTDLHSMIFKNIHEGVTFFDERNNLVFSSNRWGFLDDEDLSGENKSFDALVLKMRKKIRNFDEVLDALLLTSRKQQEVEVDVELENGDVFHFRDVPIFKDGIFKGSLLINTPKYLQIIPK